MGQQALIRAALDLAAIRHTHRHIRGADAPAIKALELAAVEFAEALQRESLEREAEARFPR